MALAAGNRVVTETILSDKLSNPLVNEPEVDGFASYLGGERTQVKTSTVDNGLNDHNTDVLDFQYLFPIDNENEAGDTTWRQYAPMSSPNAQWDQDRTGTNETAKYECLNSGQGCSNGTTGLTTVVVDWIIFWI